jgi:hypothetical protein
MVVASFHPIFPETDCFGSMMNITSSEDPWSIWRGGIGWQRGPPEEAADDLQPRAEGWEVGIRESGSTSPPPAFGVALPREIVQGGQRGVSIPS